MLLVAGGGFGLFVGLYALSAFVFGAVPVQFERSVACAQPNDISYEDNAAYEVVLLEPTLSFAIQEPPPQVLVTRSHGGGYGVYLELNPSSNGKGVTCQWEPGHVEIIEANGIVHRVPADVFTGGR